MTPQERFWLKVKKSNGCWIWTGARFKARAGAVVYGMFKIAGQPVRAHRFSYEIHYGKIPGGLEVLHTCDNGLCVKPEHLFTGTQQTNVEDMWQKGRSPFQIGTAAPQPLGEGSPVHKLTEKQVLEIRASRLSQRELAAYYGVGRTTIRHVLDGNTWKHISQGSLENGPGLMGRSQ